MLLLISKILVDLLMCYIWYSLGKKIGHKECQKLFEEFHRQRCNICELEAEYEEYGGVVDEGEAWAHEAMASRKKLEKIQEIANTYECDCAIPRILQVIEGEE